MTPKAEAQDSRFDLLKWLAVVALVVVGVVGNHYYSASPVLYRVLALLVFAAVAGFVALQTAKGKSFFALAKEARTEIRKVVWPPGGCLAWRSGNTPARDSSFPT